MTPAFEKAATSLKAKAEAVLSQQRLTNTRKRIEEAAHIEARARRDVDRADLALRLIAANAAGELPACLRPIRSVPQLEALDVALARSRDRAGRSLGHSFPYDRTTDEQALECAGEKAVEAMQPDTAKRLLPLLQSHTLREVLTALLEFKAPKREVDPVKELERKLVGARIPGFFPTPKPLAARMVELAEVSTSHRVLEPSAGSGWIAEAARDAGAFVTCVEINHTLCELLRAKKFETVCQGDFLTYECNYWFDAVVMNPPFEKGADAEHVMRALELVRPGGCVVAILGAGVFFREDTKSRAFREWLASVECDVNEELPSGTFNHSDVTQRTGVSARLIRVRRRA